MTDRPIAFKDPMVQALIAGRKTQTRRLSGLSDVNEHPEKWTLNNVGPLGYMAKASAKGKFGATFESREIEPGTLFVCPQRLPYAPGDRLWVREACRAEELSRPATTRPTTKAERDRFGRTRMPELTELDGADGVRYLADDAWRIIENTPAASDAWINLYHYRGRGENRVGNTVSPIHMPRWASRLTLTVTDVRVQRLQEICEDDAIAEGADAADIRMYPELGTARHWFEDVWNSIHGPDAWDANPWVCALTFTVERRNIDQKPSN